jgi:acyl-CoA reductase-like NAD-dependent aldehyde dehydrogenase
VPSRPLFLAGRSLLGGDVLLVRSPFDGRVVAEVARAGPAIRERAVAAAAGAAPAMARWPAHERVAVLEGTVRLLGARQEEAARTVSEEAGKPLRLARAEVLRCLDTLAAAAAVARSPEVAALDLSGYAAGAGRLALVRRVPVGPVLAITPFNFPLNLVAHKVAPAIAAGCPIVVKPASATPSPALLLAELLREAGLPDGALSVIPCTGAEAAALVEDPRFALLTFTGSDVVGWDLQRRAGRKRVALELGGNAAALVEADAGDLEDVARRIAAAAYGFAGQSCISVQRVLAHHDVAAELRAALVAATADTTAGDPSDERVVCGPLIEPREADRVESWVDAALAAGAVSRLERRRTGNLLSPVLLEGAPPDADVVRREVFGPVAVLETYTTFDEGLARVNDSRYGLQAGVFTRDLARVRRAWERLDVGGVIQGDVPSWRADAMPYGGVKDSGRGREGPAWAVREMTEERLLVLGDR